MRALQVLAWMAKQADNQMQAQGQGKFDLGSGSLSKPPAQQAKPPAPYVDKQIYPAYNSRGVAPDGSYDLNSGSLKGSPFIPAKRWNEDYNNARTFATTGDPAKKQNAYMKMMMNNIMPDPDLPLDSRIKMQELNANSLANRRKRLDEARPNLQSQTNEYNHYNMHSDYDNFTKDRSDDEVMALQSRYKKPFVGPPNTENWKTLPADIQESKRIAEGMKKTPHPAVIFNNIVRNDQNELFARRMSRNQHRDFERRRKLIQTMFNHEYYPLESANSKILMELIERGGPDSFTVDRAQNIPQPPPETSADSAYNRFAR